MPRHFIGRQAFKGRGSSSNLAGRFESLILEKADDGWYQEEVLENPAETVLPDRAKSVITSNDSPDVGFDVSINPYRGCSHGCVYCFARPTHSYLGLSPGLDFETKLFYKADAVNILQAELAKPRYVCKTIALGINTDGYQPLEKRLGAWDDGVDAAPFVIGVGVATDRAGPAQGGRAEGGGEAAVGRTAGGLAGDPCHAEAGG